jgi:hypothetical protein
VRILFAMAYPGYLRYFDSTISELLDRGHEVDLWFEVDDKQAEGLAGLPDHPGLTIHGRFPRRRDVWARAAQGERRFTDFVRYLDPRFGDAAYLRNRAARRLPPLFRPLGRLRTLPAPLARLLLRAGLALERAVPPAPEIDAFLRETGTDVVVVAPMVNYASRSADLVASARAAGIPSGAAIASWDNLTTKGQIRVLPDRVFVWNEAQRTEAAELHAVPAERVAVTGAPSYDKWFVRRPSRDRAAFAERVGLPDDRPFVLFVGSTASISAPEAERRFVREWAAALRAAPDQRLRDTAVLVRPHPFNSGHWEAGDLDAIEAAAVFPAAGANPVDEDDRNDYFDSMHHSSAVVGINTSAMIESAIVGRPVLTITPPDFADTQDNTLHFHLMLPENGGFLRVARSVPEHLEQLSGVLGDPQGAAAELDRFVASFVRPLGRDVRATDRLASEIEALAALTPEPLPRRGIAARLGLLAWRLVVSADRARRSRR